MNFKSNIKVVENLQIPQVNLVKVVVIPLLTLPAHLNLKLEPLLKDANKLMNNKSDEEKQKLPERIETAVDIIRSFCLAGVDITMNQYNNK